MADHVCCGDCNHLAYERRPSVPPTMLICRIKQRTPEERATYVGTHHRHACGEFLPRRPETVDPRIAADAYFNGLGTLVRAPSPPAPAVKSAPVPPAPAVRSPVVRSNSPFDLGARKVAQPASTPVAAPADPFDLAAR